KNTWFLYVYIFIATASLPLLCLPTCWLLRAQYPLLGTIRNVVLEFIPDNRIVTTLPTTCFALEAVIGEHDYQHNRVNQWTNLVLEQCLSQLTKLWKPFKYIVTCIILQKNGAGLQTASSCFWDNTSDGSCVERWENKSMYCIVTVFGVAI
uniref:Dynein light chain Tctex-type 1 n=1 Tax=Gasterosteus aculeatus aculeatus TaxID=481459 RepID=A0AAQ4S7C4_GASAC